MTKHSNNNKTKPIELKYTTNIITMVGKYIVQYTLSKFKSNITSIKTITKINTEI